MLVYEGEADIIEELLKHVCGTCANARTDENLPPSKRICREGYGINNVSHRCGAWRPNDTSFEDETVNAKN